MIALKGLALLWSILVTLSMIAPYQFILIQNPPVLPALLPAWLLSLFNGSIVAVDWHNLGFSVFQERLGDTHKLVRLSRALEGWCTRNLASRHICVSRAMQEWLRSHFDVRATVLYDRPPQHVFRSSVTIEAAVERLHTLLLKYDLTTEKLFGEHVVGRQTTATIKTEECTSCTDATQVIRSAASRVGLVISSTSWTADEDFSLLLRALLLVENYLAVASRGTASSSAPFDRLCVVITGKGALREQFERQLLQLTNAGLLCCYISVRPLWLEAGEYPVLLAAADLGVCLHTSTSGLDLPMKVL